MPVLMHRERISSSVPSLCAIPEIFTSLPTASPSVREVSPEAVVMSTVAGSGSITATLSGKQLTIMGTFEGLRSPATTAQLHRGIKGVRGPAILDLDLTISKAVKGTLSGSVELPPDQIADLRNGRLYVQIQSERAPDGNLWGWLLR